jgi:hypothetical protein
VQGEGLVQVNVQIKTDANIKKINIVDVLKPAEEYVEIAEEQCKFPSNNRIQNLETAHRIWHISLAIGLCEEFVMSPLQSCFHLRGYPWTYILYITAIH